MNSYSPRAVRWGCWFSDPMGTWLIHVNRLLLTIDSEQILHFSTCALQGSINLYQHTLQDRILFVLFPNGDHSFGMTRSIKQKSGLSDSGWRADTLSRSMTLTKITSYLHVEKNATHQCADGCGLPLTDSSMNLTYLRDTPGPIPHKPHPRIKMYYQVAHWKVILSRSSKIKLWPICSPCLLGYCPVTPGWHCLDKKTKTKTKYPPTSALTGKITKRARFDGGSFW